MKTLPALLVVLVAGLLTSCASTGGGAGGGIVEVNYKSPETFTDMGRTDMASRGADEGYLVELRDYIQRTGKNRLPAGSTLAVTITDVDMAGRFEPERGPQLNDVRMVRAIYPPRIQLSYRLTDVAGVVRSEGERQLTDTAFEYKLSPIDRNDPLRHEKALMDDFLRNVASEVK